MTFNYQVPKLYRSVVDDVINNVKESFLDDGVDDQVLTELKQIWESKLQASKAVEPLVEPLTTLTIPKSHHLATVPGGGHPQVLGQGNVPVFAQIPGVSRPQTTITLPAMYGQQFGGQQILQTDQGTIILQAPGTQIIRGPVAAGGQLGSVQQVVQSGGQHVNVSGANTGVVQLDGPADQEPETEKALVKKTTRTTGGKAKKSAKTRHSKNTVVKQTDGQGDSSSDDDDDEEEEEEKDDEDEERDEEGAEGVEEEPLNSDDDVSDEDPTEVFDTDNVIVCQYDKINRCKNKWKFGLKDGIMNLNGRDYVFQRASGDAEW